jgi:hypothetical protein
MPTARRKATRPATGDTVSSPPSADLGRGERIYVAAYFIAERRGAGQSREEAGALMVVDVFQTDPAT